MPQKTAADFHPEVLGWFDKYVHGVVDRRGFLNGVQKYAVGGVTATMLLEALSPQFALAQKVPKDDPRIKSSFVEFASPEGYGTMRGYLVKPANATGKLPGILVVHENRGLNPHIEDIARRLALDNFVAFAPDGLFPLGGYPGDEDKARDLFAKLDQTKSRADFIAAAKFLKGLPECTGKIGAVGFCYGGGIVNMLATRLPDLVAGVPFYGSQPTAEDAARIKASLLIHYAGNDDRHQRRLARVRSCSQGGRREIRDVQVRRNRARLQQRHDAALRRSRGQAGVGADRGVLQQDAAQLAIGVAPGARCRTFVRRSSRPVLRAGCAARSGGNAPRFRSSTPPKSRRAGIARREDRACARQWARSSPRDICA